MSTTPTTRTWEGLTIPTAGTYVLDTAHTRVGFAVKHLMVSKIRGRFADFSGTVTIAEEPMESSVEASIATGSISTGNADRDAHLVSGDFLETAKFPRMTFRTLRLTGHRGTGFTLLGELTLKDVTRAVSLDVEFDGVASSPFGQEIMAFTATTEIDREEFGITWNQALEAGGVMVGKKVRIEIEGEAIRQDA